MFQLSLFCVTLINVTDFYCYMIADLVCYLKNFIFSFNCLFTCFINLSVTYLIPLVLPNVYMYFYKFEYLFPLVLVLLSLYSTFFNPLIYNDPQPTLHPNPLEYMRTILSFRQDLSIDCHRSVIVHMYIGWWVFKMKTQILGVFTEGL